MASSSPHESSIGSDTITLLRLPPELRNRIYTFALSFGTIYTHNDRHNLPLYRRTALPQVSRQICAETSPLKYALNALDFPGTNFDPVLSTLPIEAFENVKDIRISVASGSVPPILYGEQIALLAGFKVLMTTVLVTPRLGWLLSDWAFRKGF
ncbi:hypothetical protein EK21DRAFT_108192 [Setomelanomma holmii]|uniref:Uncharacterized protein n=1 Tax=Setomelanomma holmii TaxID=210430 RepID=A0A9P4HIE8_9PLEO|nr:hypothetical protein EK21DRAFT_108192 [Setomelanomma holmii]